MSLIEAEGQYSEALKRAKKYQRICELKGVDPYLVSLDTLIDSIDTMSAVDLGVIEIPSELIVGTRTSGRKTAFAGNFMPLMGLDTELCSKWVFLCNAHLTEGIHQPIKCYEYQGYFYVEEGNKRVSVLKSFEAVSIPGGVTRLVPKYTEDPAIKTYYEFMEFFRLSRSYRFRFCRPGQYAQLQAGLGFDSDHIWTDDERRRVHSTLSFFTRTLRKRYSTATIETVSDAFLCWLQLYSFAALRDIYEGELLTKITGIWPQVVSMENDAPITVSTRETSAPSLNFFEKLIRPTHVKVAFIYEMPPEKSGWISAHEEGRLYLEKILGSAVETKAYILNSIEEAENIMDGAIADGAKVLFTTTPPLITACRRIAAKYRDIAVLNCSVSMPYPGVRTYYSRIYEGKFISGAIAGAITKNNTLGYIASNPIFGVPAGVNAFALGARMTNPDARIKLVWSCCEEDPIRTLLNEGITVISNRDVPTRQQPMEQWGLCMMTRDGTLKAVSSPYWNWGNFYIKVVSGILNGSWDEEEHRESTLNYWWGMQSGTVSVRLSDELPAGVKRLAEILKRDLSRGETDPFRTKLTAQDGSVKNDGTKDLTTEEILKMDWLCDCVDGHIPQFEELMPMAQEIVRLQGIYRVCLPPEKGGVLL